MDETPRRGVGFVTHRELWQEETRKRLEMAAARDAAVARAEAAEAAVERLIAKLAMPCGSCHPCTEWANQTWVNAGERLPHLHEWQEMRAERDAAVERVQRVREVRPSHTGCLSWREVHQALDGGEAT